MLMHRRFKGGIDRSTTSIELAEILTSKGVKLILEHAVITNHAHDHPSSVLTSLASMMRVITTTIRVFTLGDQALHRDTTQYCGGGGGGSSCNIPKHHDGEDSHLWVSILQVVSLPWADFTLVQHL